MKLALAALVALSAVPAAAQGLGDRVWTVNTPRDGDAWLIYSTPDTDDQPIAFTCVRDSGQISFAVLVPRALGVRSDDRGVWYDKVGLRAPWPASVTLASREASATLRGEADMDAVHGGSVVRSEVSIQAPVVEAFRKSGEIAVTALEETVVLPPAKPSMVRKFVRACR